MNDTLHPLIKWLVHSSLPAFATGSALLASGVNPSSFAFWWGVVGSFAGGLAGKALTVMGDNKVAKDSQEKP